MGFVTSSLLLRYLDGAVVLAADVGADALEVHHGAPAGADGAGAGHAVTLALELHVFLHRLQRSGGSCVRVCVCVCVYMSVCV